MTVAAAAEARERRSRVVDLAERGWGAAVALRLGIRRLLAARLAEEAEGGVEVQRERFEGTLRELGGGPIAVAVDAANEQHYEVPAELFRLVLGARMKYSSALWEESELDRRPAAFGATLDQRLNRAEERMLAATAARAGIEDGMDVLELGCGWGSLTLWLAERYPGCRVLALSNSASQRQYIEAACRDRGLGNVRVMTEDVNRFVAEARFDRVVSVEMFEHLRNHAALFERIAGWLRPDGRLFVHVFCHRSFAYPFEAPEDSPGAGDWMARRFFTGGLMPSEGYLLRFQRHLEVQRQWTVSGRHYEATARAWLARLDRHRGRALEVLAEAHGDDEARLWFHRWRIFFLAVAELFGYRGGTEWRVSHTLFAPRSTAGTP